MSLNAIFGLIPHEIKQPEQDSKVREQLENIHKEDFIIFLMKNGQLRFEDEIKEELYVEIEKIFVLKTNGQ